MPEEIWQKYYFNPRSHEGSDIYGYVRISTPKQFQSTLPRGERPDKIRNLREIFRFQSTLPRGERLHVTAISGYFSDFNPRSHEGSDMIFLHSLSESAISIHAPTRGATVFAIIVSASCIISIHAPTRGATSCHSN